MAREEAIGKERACEREGQNARVEIGTGNNDKARGKAKNKGRKKEMKRQQRIGSQTRKKRTEVREIKIDSKRERQK